MSRVVFFLSGALLLLLQTAGITSLPGIFAHIPLTISVATYLSNVRNVRGIWGWIIGQGVLFEVFHLGSGFFGLEFLAHTAALLAVLLLSRSVFTNRSFYGLAACAGAASFCLEAIRLLGSWMFGYAREPWNILFWTPIFSIMIVALFFMIARLLLIPPSRT